MDNKFILSSRNFYGMAVTRCMILLALLLVFSGNFLFADGPYFSQRHLIADLGDTIITANPGDVNNDGRMDVVVTCVHKFVWCENNGGNPATFTVHQFDIQGLSPMDSRAADLDGDGHTDVVVTFPNDNKVALLRNDGNNPPNFTFYTILNKPGTPWGTFIADLNNDGIKEALTCSMYSSEINWYSRQSTAPYLSPTLVTNKPYGTFTLGAADMDGDGDVDILSANISSGTYTWYENPLGTSGSWTEHTIESGASSPLKILGVDLNGDGHQDVIISDSGRPDFAWFENDGAKPPNFTKHTISLPSNSQHPLFYNAADFDHDQRMEIVCAVPNLVILKSDGAKLPNFTQQPINDSPANVGFISLADMNNDGLTDIIAVNADNNSQQLLWFANQSTSPDIHVVSPNGGEVFKSGSIIQVQWRTTLTTAGNTVSLELWDGPNYIDTLGHSRSDVGSTTQSVYLPLVPEGSNYRIRAISVLNPALFDESDAPFRITGGPLEVKMPNGGEIWRSGERQWIWWQANPLIAGTAVKLELYRYGIKAADLGYDFDPYGDGLQQITVPSLLPANNYKVRVVSIDYPGWFDETDGFVTLVNDYNRTSAEPSGWLWYR